MGEQEIEVDIGDLQGNDVAGALEALIAAAQSKIATDNYVPMASGTGSRPSTLQHSDDASPGNQRLHSNRVEDRLESWMQRKNERVDALRRQLEEQQRIQDFPASSPMAQRLSKAMSDSTMLERQREWQRRKDTRVSELKRQLDEEETRELTFRPRLSGEISDAHRSRDAREAAPSPRSGLQKDKVSVSTEIRARQQFKCEEFVSRYEKARQSKEDARAHWSYGAQYTGLPTLAKAPALRTDARAVRGAASPSSPHYTGRGPLLVSGTLLGLPAGTFVPAAVASAAVGAGNASSSLAGSGMGVASSTPSSYRRTTPGLPYTLSPEFAGWGAQPAVNLRPVSPQASPHSSSSSRAPTQHMHSHTRAGQGGRTSGEVEGVFTAGGLDGGTRVGEGRDTEKYYPPANAAAGGGGTLSARDMYANPAVLAALHAQFAS